MRALTRRGTLSDGEDLVFRCDKFYRLLARRNERRRHDTSFGAQANVHYSNTTYCTLVLGHTLTYNLPTIDNK